MSIAALLLLASCLAHSAIALPQAKTVTDIVTITDHVAQTDHTLVTDHTIVTDHTVVTDYQTVTDTPQAPVIEVDVNIKILAGEDTTGILITTVMTTNTSVSVESSTPDQTSAPLETSISAEPSASADESTPPLSTILVGPSSTTTPQGTLVTLKPAVHWDHDLQDLANLEPIDSPSVYYCENGVADPETAHQFASVTSNLSYPAVVLEHSAYVSGVQCEADGIIITFTTEAAVSVAENTWPSQLLIVTHTSGCSDGGNTAQAYFLSSSVSFHGLDAIVKAAEVTIEVAATDIDLTWGQYQPGNSSSPNSGNSATTTAMPQPEYTPASDTLANTPAEETATNTGTVAEETSASFLAGQAPSTTSFVGCATPPAATISGLPAVACGQDFDAALDRLLGFVSFSESNLIHDIAPGLPDTNISDYDDLNLTDAGVITRSAHEKRFISVRNIAKSFANVAKKGVQAASQTIKSAAGAVVNAGKEIGKAVLDTVSSLLSPSIDKTFSINLGPKSLVQSPWGAAYQLFRKDKENNAGTASGSITLYCVDCGMTGTVHVGGQVAFSIASAQITKGTIGLDGNIQAGLFLGLAAEAQYQRSFTSPIASAGIPGLTIPNIITVGPVLKLDAELDLGIIAAGNLLAGAQMTIANFGANLDIVSGQSSANFKPIFTNRFEVSGEIGATAGLGLPITVGVGLTIPPIKFQKLVSIINKPSIQVSATYAYSTTDTSLTCNNGVAYSINFLDDTTYNLFDFKTGDIFKYTSPDLVSGCKQLGSSPISSSVSSSSTQQPAQRALDARQSLGNSSDSGFGDGYVNGTISYNPANDTLSHDEYNDISNLAFNGSANNTANTDGSVYVQLQDETGQYLLAADDSGSFNLVDTNASTGAASSTGTNFLSFDNVTVADEMNRLFVYFPTTMRTLGVSRFRLVDGSNDPNTANLVALTPLNYDGLQNTPGVYIAESTTGDFFYTVVCNIQGQMSKVFLVTDLTTGVETLKREDLRYTVTGGVVDACYPIAFLSAGPGL